MFRAVEVLFGGKTNVVPTWDILSFFTDWISTTETIPQGKTLLVFSPKFDKEIIIDGELYCE